MKNDVTILCDVPHHKGELFSKIYCKRKYLVNSDVPSKVSVINVHKRRENIKFPVGKQIISNQYLR